MQTEREVRAYIMLKATEDEAFRARLLAAPKGVVEAEAGVSFPADYTFHVHEETATDAHMILPISSQLSPEDLQAITGAAEWWMPDHDEKYDHTHPNAPGS